MVPRGTARSVVSRVLLFACLLHIWCPGVSGSEATGASGSTAAKKQANVTATVTGTPTAALTAAPTVVTASPTLATVSPTAATTARPTLPVTAKPMPATGAPTSSILGGIKSKLGQKVAAAGADAAKDATEKAAAKLAAQLTINTNSTEPDDSPSLDDFWGNITNTTCVMDYIRGVSKSQLEHLDNTRSSAEARNVRMLVSGLSVAFGVAFCFFGREIFKPTLFLLGFLLAAFLTMLTVGVVLKLVHASDDTTCEMLTYGTIIGGVFGGIIVLCVFKLTLFALGALSGAVIGYGAYLVYLHNYLLGMIAGKDGMFWLCTAGMGLLCGIIALKTQKKLIVLATALTGAMLAVVGTDEFICAIQHKASLGKESQKGTIDTIEMFCVASLACAGGYLQYKRSKPNTGAMEEELLEREWKQRQKART